MLITGSDQTNPINNNSNFELLTIAEVAEILKVHISTVYEMMNRGEIQSVHFGKMKRIRRQDLEEFITNHLEGNRS